MIIIYLSTLLAIPTMICILFLTNLSGWEQMLMVILAIIYNLMVFVLLGAIAMRKLLYKGSRL